jgi:hypothetical protein
LWGYRGWGETLSVMERRLEEGGKGKNNEWPLLDWAMALDTYHIGLIVFNPLPSQSYLCKLGAYAYFHREKWLNKRLRS